MKRSPLAKRSPRSPRAHDRRELSQLCRDVKVNPATHRGIRALHFASGSRVTTVGRLPAIPGHVLLPRGWVRVAGRKRKIVGQNMRILLQGMFLFGALALLDCAAPLPAKAKDAFQTPDVAQAIAERFPLPLEATSALVSISPSHDVSLTNVLPSGDIPKTPNAQQYGTAFPPEETTPRLLEDGGQATDMPGAKSTTGDAASPPPAGETQYPAPQESLPAVNAALKSALEARFALPDPLGLLHRREREAIAAFYTARDFAPLWWSAGSPTAEAAAVFERLKRASDDGLDIKGFALALAASTDQEIAAVDIALTDAVVAYGRQASGSRVDPHMISRLIGAEPEIADPAVILALVSTAGESAGDELRKFNPQQKGYLALREKLAELRRGRGVAGRDRRVPFCSRARERRRPFRGPTGSGKPQRTYL
jgi:hypothetical protein